MFNFTVKIGQKIKGTNTRQIHIKYSLYFWTLQSRTILYWHRMDVPDVEIDEAEEEISGEGEAVGDGDEQQSVNFSDQDFDSSEVNLENIQPNFNCNLN